MGEDAAAPFGAVLDRARGGVEPVGSVAERRISDLEHLYEDRTAWQQAVEGGNPLVYTVVAAPVPEVAGEVPFSITTIEPGMVGEEFFMTKGHAHTAYEGELYVGLAGRGVLLLFNGEEARWVQIVRDAAGYIPPGWAHRTVNVGDEPFRFLAVYPGSAGHDYAYVVENGMGARVVRRSGGFEVVESTAGTPVQEAVLHEEQGGKSKGA